MLVCGKGTTCRSNWAPDIQSPRRGSFPGLAVELFKSVPYGKRAILVAKQNNVDELFQKEGFQTMPGLFQLLSHRTVLKTY